MSTQAMVREFHEAFGCAIDQPLTEPLRQLRCRLIEEEVHELAFALFIQNRLSIAKELADVLYVVYGTAVSFGIDLEAAVIDAKLNFLSKLNFLTGGFLPEVKPLFTGDLSEITEGLVKFVYGAVWTAIECRIDLHIAVSVVHESNMSKLGADGKPILRSDGKVLKGPHYVAPDLTAALLDIPELEDRWR